LHDYHAAILPHLRPAAKRSAGSGGSFPAFHYHPVNPRSRGIMVNARMVNAGVPCVFPPHFCEIFRDSGRISRLRNPFKYIRNFHLNRKTVHLSGPGIHGFQEIFCKNNTMRDH
jgi:hypothetical protein